MTNKKILTFEDFWRKHEYSFPGFASGAQIAEICKDIARDAWELSSGLDKADSSLDKADSSKEDHDGLPQTTLR